MAGAASKLEVGSGELIWVADSRDEACAKLDLPGVANE